MLKLTYSVHQMVISITETERTHPSDCIRYLRMVLLANWCDLDPDTELCRKNNIPMEECH